MRNNTRIIASALLISADTRPTTVASLYSDAEGNEATSSFARSLIAARYSDVTSNKDAAALLVNRTTGKNVSEQQVTNMRKNVRNWEATGLSEAAVADAWFLVSVTWVNRWAKDEGKALMAAIQATEGDEGKIALLRGEPATEVKVVTEADLIRTLTRAAEQATVLPVLSAESAAIVAALLAEIASAATAPAAVLVAA